MAQAEIDDLAPALLARGLHRLANLAVGIMAVLVQQRRGDFDFERLFVEQINNRLRAARSARHRHQFARGLPKFAPRFHLIRIRIGIFH